MIAKTGSKRLLQYIDRFPKARILVVGDMMLDHYIWGNVSRISPEAPVPVVHVTKETVLLGAAANVVNNVHALGGSVRVCGVIGHDDAGRQLSHMLRAKGIPADGLIVESGRPTTIKTRVIAHSQQVVRFDRETKDGIDRDTHRRIYDAVKQHVDDGLDAIILSDYSKGVVTKELVRDIVKLTSKRDLIVSVDPKVNHFGIYSGVTILTPNTKEASLGSKIEIESEKSLLKAGTALLKRLKCKAVLITRGEQGMSLFERGRQDHPHPDGGAGGLRRYRRGRYGDQHAHPCHGRRRTHGGRGPALECRRRHRCGGGGNGNGEPEELKRKRIMNM